MTTVLCLSLVIAATASAQPVDVSDRGIAAFFRLTADYGDARVAGSVAGATSDLNQDGEVDQQDLLAFMSAWFATREAEAEDRSRQSTKDESETADPTRP